MNLTGNLAAALAVLTSLTSFATYAAADEFDQHTAHVHGSVVVNVAIDADRLTIEIDAPAGNVVGFEHAPRSADDRQRLAAAERWLRSGRGAIGVPAAADCRLDSVSLQSPVWRESDGNADHGHADFEALMKFDCRDASQLRFVDLWLLKRLPNVASATVNIVTASLQTATTATPAATRVSLR
ncbi:MAG: DUF2796 domain-containing protein [Pseudomonadales bacterium]|nr:DUF2796 domain-containing protein [Pseudomonadales bacterium]